MRRADYFPTHRALLCSVHFEERCFYRLGQKTQLREDAVPTKFYFPTQKQQQQTVRVGHFVYIRCFSCSFMLSATSLCSPVEVGRFVYISGVSVSVLVSSQDDIIGLAEAHIYALCHVSQQPPSLLSPFFPPPPPPPPPYSHSPLPMVALKTKQYQSWSR